MTLLKIRDKKKKFELFGEIFLLANMNINNIFKILFFVKQYRDQFLFDKDFFKSLYCYRDDSNYQTS